MDFLKTLKVPSPVFPNDDNKLVTLSGDASIADGFQALISNNVLSIPLYDDGAHTYNGSLNIVDVLLHVLSSLDEAELESGVCSAFATVHGKDAFRTSKVRDVAGISRRTPIIAKSTASIDEIAKLMVKTRAHQVLGLDDKGDLTNIITQSRIVECVSTLFNIDPALTALGQQTVQQLSLGLQKVLSVSENDKAIDAFRMLAEHNVTGLAVVKPNSSVIIGNISGRDLRMIKHNASFLKLLNLPVSDYLEACRSEFGMPQSVITCGLQDTYRTVMERIMEKKVHRCYVVNDNNELLGVVSLWDLLNQLVSFSCPVNAP